MAVVPTHGMVVATKEMSGMFESYELRRNGPYLRVILPDVLPPDWTALARDLELDEGVKSATLVTPHIDVADGDLDRILAAVVVADPPRRASAPGAARGCVARSGVAP